MSHLEARWLESAPDGWSELLEADPNATPGHRPELWSALAAVQPSLALRVAAVEREGVLIGGLAVLVERRGGFHWIHALPHLLPGAPLARPGAHADVDHAVAAALAELQATLASVGGEWALYRPAGPAVGAGAVARVSGETRLLETALLDLSLTRDETLRRMDRKTRKELRLAAEAGLGFAEEPSALEEAYALHARQARAWRRHRALPLELSRRLLEPGAGGAPPAARLFTVRDGAGLLCAAFALDASRETLLWWSGAREQARETFAFPFLLGSVAEWARRAGRARLNLGASGGLSGVELFKADLGATAVPYPVRWLDAGHASAPGRLLARLQSRIRRGRPRGAVAGPP